MNRYAVSIAARSKSGEDSMFHHNLTIREASNPDAAKEAAKLAFFRMEGRGQAKIMSCLAEPVE